MSRKLAAKMSANVYENLEIFWNRTSAGAYATDATINANVFFSYQNNQGPMLQTLFSTIWEF
jgi:hypothetical protein